MLGRLMTEWLTSSAQCEEAPEKVRLLKSEREDREFLLFFFSLSTLQERDFLKRGGSYDDASLSFPRVGMDPNASTSSLFFYSFF